MRKWFGKTKLESPASGGQAKPDQRPAGKKSAPSSKAASAASSRLSSPGHLLKQQQDTYSKQPSPVQDAPQPKPQPASVQEGHIREPKPPEVLSPGVRSSESSVDYSDEDSQVSVHCKRTSSLFAPFSLCASVRGGTVGR